MTLKERKLIVEKLKEILLSIDVGMGTYAEAQIEDLIKDIKDNKI